MELAEIAELQREREYDRDGLTAAAGPPLVPPRPWFELEEPDEGPVGWTVTADGQVFGHAAVWGTCHTGKPGKCITPPKSRSDYAFYKTGLTEVDDGELIPTGRITLGTGHASLTASPAATAEHYDNTGAVVADVTVRDGKHGIWVTGALRPGVTPERARELRGASLSGDWRSIRGGLEMLGLLAVNVPGFPVPRAMSASGAEDEVLALVAAGIFADDVQILPETEDHELEAEFKALYAGAMKRSDAFLSKKQKVKDALCATAAVDGLPLVVEVPEEFIGAIELVDLTDEETLALLADASPGRARMRKIAKVMREFKAGTLKDGNGNKVTSRKQALAIAMSESKHLTAATKVEDEDEDDEPEVRDDATDDFEEEVVEEADEEEEGDDDEEEDEEEEEVTAAGFTESKHPRHRKGDPRGGQFAAKGVGKEAPEGGRYEDWSDEELQTFVDAKLDESGGEFSLDERLAQEELDNRRRRKIAPAAQRRSISGPKPGDYEGQAKAADQSAEANEARAVALRKEGNEEHAKDYDAAAARARARAAELRKKLTASAEECDECEPVPVEDFPGELILAASFTQGQRERLARKGEAMEDGSFPIRNRGDLRNAIQASGRAADPEAARAWIVKRARALKAVGDLPASWNIRASGEEDWQEAFRAEFSERELVAAGARGAFTEGLHPRHPKGRKDGGQFAPKGTSKLAPRPDEAGAAAESRRTMGGKLIRGPGGKLMSRTEAGVLLDKERGKRAPTQDRLPGHEYPEDEMVNPFESTSDEELQAIFDKALKKPAAKWTLEEQQAAAELDWRKRNEATRDFYTRVALG